MTEGAGLNNLHEVFDITGISDYPLVTYDWYSIEDMDGGPTN